MKFKLEQFLFYFLFFAIPLQTRKILYSPGWYYNEWQSVSLYFTDLILLALFIFWGFNHILATQNTNHKTQITNKSQNTNHKKFLNFFHLRQGFGGQVISQFLKPDFYLVLFLAAAAVSIKNSSDFYVGAFLWLKLVEFALFYFYLKIYAIRRFGFVGVLYTLIIGGVFQAVIAIGQFLKQGDLGLRWLGESVLGSQMVGIASFYTSVGDKVIRAYGTTPHSNVLAAYLFLAIVAFYFVVFYTKPNKFLVHSGHFIMLIGLFASFSRTIIFLFFANFFGRGFLVNFVKRFREKYLFGNFFKKKIVPIFLVTVIATVAFMSFYWPEIQSRMTLSSEEEAVQLRVFYNKESLGGGINLFGIGLGDFTGWLMEQNPNLPSYMYQPVHNIYLLIYSEVGILGLIFFLLFLAGLFYEFIKKTQLRELKHYSFLLVAVSVLFIGLFDHFLLTIQQGRFIFWLSLALLGALAPSLNKYFPENDPE
ncbi:MAG: hypothetical protein HY505_00970 [Candidatus Yanofskybacteria bacterium]|nr:hypothetical protein [Candidatus Yanofskybacteria bacterium]